MKTHTEMKNDKTEINLFFAQTFLSTYIKTPKDSFMFQLMCEQLQQFYFG